MGYPCSTATTQHPPAFTSRPRLLSCTRSRGSVRRQAAQQELLPKGLFRDGLKTEVHDGIYGAWSVDDADIAEVLGYRAGIILSALCATAVFAAAGATDEQLLPPAALNALCLAGTAGFGASLVLIHIYVTEIKRTIQALFLFGALGEVWLMASKDQAAVNFVAEHPWATLLVGPAFAAVTGVAIKEGLCYGKPNAASLALVTPFWLMGHLTKLMPPTVDKVFAGVFIANFLYFASQKVTQNIKDDIGDKSVFTFRKLPETEQEEIVRKLQEAGKLDM
eukprot:jgi/Ulvmu1/884/UM100_0039.1